MRTIFHCPRCAWGFRRTYVPAGALEDARAEVEHLREKLDEHYSEGYEDGYDAAVADYAASDLA